MSIPSIENCNIYNKVVLLRVDFNIPRKNEKIQDMIRILRALNTIKYLVNGGAKVVIISHFGRPKNHDDKFSLKFVVRPLSKLLNQEVKFIDDCIGEKVQEVVNTMFLGDVTLLENLRFYQEEERNCPNFAKQLASIADLYVNDAFSCSHRVHASIDCITEFLPSYAGFSMQDELKYLEKSISFQAKPITAIVGGSKISTKIKMLEKLAEKVDFIILGGAIANNFLFFNKVNIGKSLFQEDMDDLSSNILQIASKNNCKIIVPEDVLIAVNSNYSTSITKKTEFITDNDVILDIGPQTLRIIISIIESSKTVIWNGPVGMFEYPAFANGTMKLMNIIRDLTRKKNLTSVIGGGDSLSALNTVGLTDKDFTYVSTGGGAFLGWLSGEKMPGVIALQKLYKEN